VDPVGHGLDKGGQEAGGGLHVGGFVQLGEGIFGRPVHGHEEVQLALLCTHLGDVDVEVADQIGWKGCLAGLSPGISGNR
jgi:hypothetical protein